VIRLLSRPIQVIRCPKSKIRRFLIGLRVLYGLQARTHGMVTAVSLTSGMSADAFAATLRLDFAIHAGPQVQQVLLRAAGQRVLELEPDHRTSEL